MCGIAGFVGLNDEALLRRMCRSLTHRGPDSEGFYAVPGVGLSMRRLAVIDLATGNQPISNENADVWVVFNGEIYNYQELRKELQERGHRLVTTSDTETIPHLYEEYGLEFVHHLRGMFGIALWDVKRSRLVVVRDRIGEKPLYFATDGPALWFGSEIKALLQAGRSRQPDAQGVCDFLAQGYVAGPHTFYRGISKLRPGEMLVHEHGTATVRKYWTRDTNRPETMPSESEAASQLTDRLREVVRLCLKSDVEVGAFLSGGIDSSLLVALMREQEAKVQTFSVGYRGKATGFNELHYASRVAKQLGTEHHELILGPSSTLDLLPRILWHYDEPHGEPTSTLVYQLSEFTAKRVKVAIGGTGGDEIFFGYPRHGGIRLLNYYRHIPQFVRQHLVERVVSAWPESTTGGRFAKRVKRFVSGSHLPADHAYLSWVSLLQADVRQGLIADQVRRDAPSPGGDAFLRHHLLESRSAALLDRAAALDIDGYLPEYQLAYVDRMSMAHGLEVRSPLCDYQLVTWVASLPAHYRLKGGRSKHLLKEVARAWLPPAIIDRKKVGFDSPIGQWFKDDLRRFLLDFLAPEQVARTGLLSPSAVSRVVQEHLSGARDYSLQLWSVVALEAWHRMYIEDRVTDGSDYRLSDLRGVSRAAAGVAQAPSVTTLHARKAEMAR